MFVAAIISLFLQVQPLASADGTGKEITFAIPNGIISWLSLQTNEKSGEEVSLTFFEKLVTWFRDIFNKLLALLGM